MRSPVTADGERPRTKRRVPSAIAKKAKNPRGDKLIRIRGARQNNLKGFNLDLPHGILCVITGPSGSGKSSLAFETLFAEGQRRYVETFSPYTRQFFDRMDKPRVDSIEGIPAAIAIKQTNSVRTTRSTIGTMTEICDYLKVLWPHLSQIHCRQCGVPVQREAASSVARICLESQRFAGRDLLITFDLPLSKKLSGAESLRLLASQGYARVILGNQVKRVDDSALAAALSQSASPFITVIQDRVKACAANRARLAAACEQAYHFGRGKAAIRLGQNGSQENGLPPHYFSNRLHCAACDIEYRQPAPAMFSFNHPLGACPDCRGFGRIIGIEDRLVLPDRKRTLRQGVVKPWLTGHGLESQQDLLKFCRKRNVPVDVPFHELPLSIQNWVIDGDPGYGSDPEHQWPAAWYGVRGYFRWLEGRAYKMHIRVLLSRYRSYRECPACHGARFQPESLLYKTAGLSPLHVPMTLADFYRLTIRDACRWITQQNTDSAGSQKDPIQVALGEARARLQFLVEAGLGYLTLDRPTRTLSGGETERVNLTTCLGARLVNTLYVLDEPTVGLHPRDTNRLLTILEQLRDAGNTVVVVEHEPAVMRAADYLVDIGPGSGASGGELVYAGDIQGILNHEGSPTGRYLSNREPIRVPRRRSVQRAIPPRNYEASTAPKVELNDAPYSTSQSATPNAGGDIRKLPHSARTEVSHVNWLSIRNATQHNLNQLNVEIPLGRFVCISGVSGSGKTTLIKEILWPMLQSQFQQGQGASAAPLDNEEKDGEEVWSTGEGKHATLHGAERLDGALFVDQTSIGRTPRSNPAIYSGAFDAIRELFASLASARTKGIRPGNFSFNSRWGQCARCRGAGFEKIEMQFLTDVFIVCPDCGGKRYQGPVLEIRMPIPAAVRGELESTSRGPEGLNIAEILDLTIDQAAALFSALSSSKHAGRANKCLSVLQTVGLGYLRLGQPVNTLSGGESQRLKLASHLAELNSKRGFSAANKTLFLFDEPTTGLHPRDVGLLLQVLQNLVDRGHSVIVIEHQLDVIKSADWVIDLGPDAAAEGGRLVACGTPEEISKCDLSHTGRALQSVLGG